nr:hypothetical protein [Parasaccharibacter sp. TMW2.1882]
MRILKEKVAGQASANPADDRHPVQTDASGTNRIAPYIQRQEHSISVSPFKIDRA